MGAQRPRVVVLDFDSTLTAPIFLERARAWAIADKPELLATMGPEELVANFGGAARIAALDALLGALRELCIVSIGYKRAIVPQLRGVGLLRHFDAARIFGQDSRELRSVGYVKADLIAALAAEHGWAPADILFVDDSEEHVDAARARGVCATFLVRLVSSVVPLH
mmetsp:Transcript_7762/g.32117  ORF Transcript_7762/g.32117 Transcript_7762/m.32117 type:complete len:166 (-) Transcript_7762:275-772(-)